MLVPFYIRTSRLGENILINGTRYDYPCGGVFCELLNFAQTFDLAALNDFSHFLETISTSHSPIFEISTIPSRINALPFSPLLKDILLWQPVNGAAQLNSDPYSCVDYSSYEKRRIEAKSPPEYDIEQSILLRAHSPCRWNEFYTILSNPQHTAMYTPDQIKELRVCVNHYYKQFLNLIFYLRRLHFHLSNYFSLTTYQEQELPQIFTSSSFSITKESIFPDKEHRVRYSSTYIVDELPALLSVEYQQYAITRAKIKLCKLCHKYFLPSRKNNIYCPNPNQRFNNQRCCDAASLLSLLNKTKEYPMQAEFAKACKAYAKWCREADAWCREHIIDSPKEKKDIIDAIYNTYKEWKHNARNAQVALSVGYITEDALLDALTIPSVFDRSPELAKWKRILRKRN